MLDWQTALGDGVQEVAFVPYLPLLKKDCCWFIHKDCISSSKDPERRVVLPPLGVPVTFG